MSIWQKFRMKHGITWYKKDWQILVQTIVCLIVASALIWSIVVLAIRVVDYNRVQHEAQANKRLADIREQKMIDCLSGKKIATLPAGFKLKDVYYCNVSALRFSTDTN